MVLSGIGALYQILNCNIHDISIKTLMRHSKIQENVFSQRHIPRHNYRHIFIHNFQTFKCTNNN